MSLSIHFHHLISSPQTHLKFPSLRPRKVAIFPLPKLSRISSTIKSLHGSHDSPVPLVEKPRWENMLGTAASLYPLYVTVGGVVACMKPATFSWFVKRAPVSYNFALGFVMLVMGVTLELKEFFRLLMQRHFSILFGFVAQYTILPVLGMVISKSLRLSPFVSVGFVLLSCCPGGIASNVVTLIAQGDVPLSIVMTVCTTLGAVVLTPFLTKILVGTYVPVDALKLSISTLQVVVFPILLGSYIQSIFPAAVKAITPFTPLLAVLASSLLTCSVFSENIVHLKSSIVSASMAPDPSPLLRIKEILSSDLGAIILSVMLLHFTGFIVGYVSAAICGFGEKQRRAISIEIGMQNSVLGVVLATSHFTSPLVALPSAVSAVIMNIMGSSLGFIWRNIDPSDSNNRPKVEEK